MFTVKPYIIFQENQFSLNLITLNSEYGYFSSVSRRHKVISLTCMYLVFNAPFERNNSVFNKQTEENANNANYNRIYTYGGDALESRICARVVYT